MMNGRPVDNLPPNFGTMLDYIGSVIVTIVDAVFDDRNEYRDGARYSNGGKKHAAG